VNRTELIDAAAGAADLSPDDMARALDALTATITQRVARGDRVAVAGFGHFECKVRAPRTGRNPRTGEEIEIGERRLPAFKAGKAFKDAVAG